MNILRQIANNIKSNRFNIHIIFFVYDITNAYKLRIMFIKNIVIIIYSRFIVNDTIPVKIFNKIINNNFVTNNGMFLFFNSSIINH